MTENEQTTTTQSSFVDTKFGKVLLTIIAVVLVFAGPTYGTYALVNLLKFNGYASFAVGMVIFAVGLIMMWYLAKKKIIT